MRNGQTFKPSYFGDPIRPVLWGEEEQQNERALGNAGSEGCGACDDERASVAHLSSARDNCLLQFTRPPNWAVFFTFIC